MTTYSRMIDGARVGVWLRRWNGRLTLVVAGFVSSAVLAQPTPAQPNPAPGQSAATSPGVNVSETTASDRPTGIDWAAIERREAERVAAIDRAMKSAVAIFADGGRGGGSGVVISPDGFAISNYHVTSPAGTFMKCGMSDGEVYDAVIVGIDPVGDVALIKLFTKPGQEGFTPAEIADSDQVRMGDWCFVIGNPFLLATDLKPTVTYGLISGTNRYQFPAGTLLEYADCLQTDASINPGNSGGPLFDAQGRLIGINGRGSFEKRGRVNVGVGYAISINQVMHFLGCLKSGRIVDHATLGATVASDSDGRVVVSNILETSDAYHQGLRYGDQILRFGGRSIVSPNAFKNVLGIFPRGYRVPLTFVRNGQRREIDVKLAGVHSPEELLNKIDPVKPAERPGAPRPGAPRPGRPGGDRPGPAPGGPQPEAPQPGGPMPEGPIPGAAKMEISDSFDPAIKSWYQARRGFANYHFNRLAIERLDQAITAAAWPKAEEITFQGVTDANEPFSITLAAGETRGDLPAGQYVVSGDKSLETQLEPPGTGGLLAAMHLWRRLMTGGTAAYGDVTYYGTAPLTLGGEGQDVLIGTYDVTEAWFYFDAASGDLTRLEMTADPDTPECMITFSEYQTVGGIRRPTVMTVQHGGKTLMTLRVSS